jgi:hypothetical protein
LPYGSSTFSILELTETGPIVKSVSGAGAYFESFDADVNGNWIIGDKAGFVKYSDLTFDMQPLNFGKPRHVTGNRNGYCAVSTSSGQALAYQLNNDKLTLLGVFEVDAGKVLLSLDGKFLACGNNGNDAQYAINHSLHLFNILNHSLIKTWPHNYLHDHISDNLFDFNLSSTGTMISQRAGKWNGNNWTFVNYLTKSNTADSLFLNRDSNGGFDFESESAKISPSEEYMLTALKTPGSSTGGITKIYKAGILTNALDGYSSGWITDDLLILNQLASGSGLISYHAYIYSTSGQVNTTYKLPFEIKNHVAISEEELFVNTSKVINIKSGAVLYTLPVLPNDAAIVGKDYLLIYSTEGLKMINWREQANNTLWYRDADGDGYGTPTNTAVGINQPSGFVTDNSDCDDSDSTVNPNKRWYPDNDADGFGDPWTPLSLEKFQCEKPVGYASNNLDCDDTNAALTPLNLCITAIADNDFLLSVFPNPGNGIYTIKHNYKEIDFTIISAQGKYIHPVYQ